LISCVSKAGSGPPPGTAIWLLFVVVVVVVFTTVSECVQLDVKVCKPCARAPSGVAISNGPAAIAASQCAARVRSTRVEDAIPPHPSRHSESA
jgi:hypothetical protein